MAERLGEFFDRFNPFALLAVSIVLEVFGATMMKVSDGFTVPVPTLLSLTAYIVSFGIFTFALRRLPLGVAYGIWGGSGTVLTAIIGIVVWHDAFGWGTALGIALVVGGIVLLNKGDEECQAKKAAAEQAKKAE